MELEAQRSNQASGHQSGALKSKRAEQHQYVLCLFVMLASAARPGRTGPTMKETFFRGGVRANHDRQVTRGDRYWCCHCEHDVAGRLEHIFGTGVPAVSRRAAGHAMLRADPVKVPFRPFQSF